MALPKLKASFSNSRKYYLFFMTLFIETLLGFYFGIFTNIKDYDYLLLGCSFLAVFSFVLFFQGKKVETYNTHLTVKRITHVKQYMWEDLINWAAMQNMAGDLLIVLYFNNGTLRINSFPVESPFSPFYYYFNARLENFPEKGIHFLAFLKLLIVFFLLSGILAFSAFKLRAYLFEN
ncbi:MAG: hypothetical protein A3K10_14255 [Bacteroidetes bacterium RIFCSPLOWO2_12_FULL_31_6]|nr:MAG: hypothetical protein A3K10_14255 [Bacteroidetes bacterium RIFCSPLOWO2_12_FULL_31_6]